MPCSCYNLSVTNDSTILDKVILPQLSRLGQLARSRHSTDICAVPAKSHIYREVGRGSEHKPVEWGWACGRGRAVSE